jgi:hypothetical protein
MPACGFGAAIVDDPPTGAQHTSTPSCIHSLRWRGTSWRGTKIERTSRSLHSFLLLNLNRNLARRVRGIYSSTALAMASMAWCHDVTMAAPSPRPRDGSVHHADAKCARARCRWNAGARLLAPPHGVLGGTENARAECADVLDGALGTESYSWRAGPAQVTRHTNDTLGDRGRDEHSLTLTLTLTSFEWKREDGGDAFDFIYDNPYSSGQAVGGGEDAEPEEMSVATSVVYEMLLSSDRSILDNMMVMVELLARREPLIVASSQERLLVRPASTTSPRPSWSSTTARSASCST